MDPRLIQAFGRTLTETEWLPPEKLRAYQAPLLGKLLRHAQQTTDFYRGRFDFDIGSDEEIERNWARVPIFARADAIANRERLFSRSMPPDAGAVVADQTSGSTGMAFHYRNSQINLIASQALTERLWRWWKVDGTRPFARISYDHQNNAAPPQGATLLGWHSAHPRAPQHVLAATADVETQVAWLAARTPAYLATYSSLLKEIAASCRRTGIRLKFELLFSFGTVVDDETRNLCRDVLGAEIADTYGAMEAGHFASQCPQCGEYHVSAETERVEILRDDGSAAEDGEVGRVVVTVLYNYAMPLIRYALGDFAEAGSSRARCRRGLPCLRRILGRDRNLFRFRDGTTIWPSPGRFREFLPVKQFQVVQTDFDHVAIRYVAEHPDRPVDFAAVTREVRATLGQPVAVDLHAVAAIPRSPSGKYEDFISHVSANSADD